MHDTSDSRFEARRFPRERGHAGGNPAPRAALALLLVVAAGGCSDWSRYWDPSPARTGGGPDTRPPSVRIVSPSGADSAHATPVSGSDYTIVVSADDDRGVASVDVVVDSGPALRLTTSPWTVAWNTSALEEGSIHSVVAIATDGAGNRTTSAAVFAQTFNAGPQLEIAGVEEGARVRGTIAIAAEFTGPVPEVDRVEYLCDVGLLGVATSDPWTLSLDTRALPPGEHFLTARATTRIGHVGVSPPRRILVNNETPTALVDFPPAGHRIAARGTLVLSAIARDTVDGALSRDQIAWRSSLDGAIGNGSYLRIGGLSVGTHEITVTGTNAWGTSGASSVQVEVRAAPTYPYCSVIYTQILYGNCASCHAPGTPEYVQSGFDVTTLATLRSGGVSRQYEAIVPCRPESSLVWNKISTETPWVGARMPPRDRGYNALHPIVQQKIRTWILEGAPPDDPPTCNR